MIVPTIACYSFCDYVLNSPIKRLSAARQVIVSAIQTAAYAQTGVTNDDWNNFLLSVNDYYQAWLVDSTYNPNAIYDSDAILYFQTVTTPLTYSRKQYINSFVLQLKADGNWTKLDRLWLFASQAQDQAKISLVNPLSTQITEVNTPTWTADEGYTGGATNKYINLNYTPSTSAVNYAQNSATLGFYSRTNNTETVGDMGAEEAAGVHAAYAYARFTDGKSYMTLNDNGTTSSPPSVADSLGLFSAQRTVSTTVNFYKRGTNIGSKAEASTGLCNKSFFLANISNNGAPFGSTSRQYAMAYTGSGGIDIAKLYTSIQTFLTSIGANV